MPADRIRLVATIVAVIFGAVAAATALAHCDTLDGPVVADARVAIEKKDLTPVLKWIGPSDEAEVRGAFANTLVVRALSPEAKELADRAFFETVVRLHRAKEGEPYAGLKPAGTDPGPAVRAVDRSLESGSPDALVRLISDRAGEGLRRQFARVQEARRHADDSVEAGRVFTKAYAELAHAAERLYETAGPAPDAPAAAHHH
ncbi:MAG TPA: DUF6448 family protein [Thermoanaerobaculia bacterium]|nr:DUF6448 family protein [Thermoanaerobaculia bacterium]